MNLFGCDRICFRAGLRDHAGNEGPSRGDARAVLGAIAGIFHGYAYGESIVGAEMTPLVAYLAGFTIIQLIIALGGYKIGKFWMEKFSEPPLLNLQFAGFTICGAGAAFLAGAILG